MLKRSPKTLPASRTEYPDGTYLLVSGKYYYVFNQKLFPFTTARAVESWRPYTIVETSTSAIEHYPIGSNMKFRSGSLLYSQSTGKMYLISGNNALHITSPDVLTRLNLKRSDAVWVSEDEIKLHKLGERIS